MKAAALEILRDANIVHEDRWLGESWVPPHALSDRDLWTYTSVKDVLVDSFVLLRRSVGRVGPSTMKAAWPEYALEQGDFVQQELNNTLKARRAAERLSRRSELRHSSKQLSSETEQQTRMEAVLLGWKDDKGAHHPAWLAGPLLTYPQFREKLIAWVMSEVRNEPSTEMCQRRGWVLRTMERHRDKAAAMIADRLNRAEIEVW